MAADYTLLSMCSYNVNRSGQRQWQYANATHLHSECTDWLGKKDL